MDLFNKVKNHVTKVLPGNPLGGEFDMGDQEASGGPGLMWKIYSGTKKTTKQPVSIFVFEKKLIDRHSRRDKEFILESLRKGVSQLTRLRHPKILSVLHPLEDTREYLAYATEPVFGSLANVLGNLENVPSPPPKDLQEFKLYDVEIKYGLLQVTEGLKFIHNDVKMVHGNLCPSSIYINKDGGWKLGGFDCCIKNANQNDQSTIEKNKNAYYPCKEWDPGLSPVVQATLNYLAPENVLSASCDTNSDMFSLGVLFYAIFNNGRTFLDCRGEFTEYKRNTNKLRNLPPSTLNSIPEDVREHVKMLLNIEPTVRPDADQISQVQFFQDVGAMTLQYIDTLVQQDNLQKSQYFKGLPQVISKLPKRVCIQRVLPSLMRETTNNNMIPFILPNVMQIGEMTTDREFAKFILPRLIPVFKIQDPIQITLIFLQNMTLLLSKTPQADIRNHVLPMVYRALEADSPQIQQLCLNIIPTFASLVEYSSMKSALVPRIQKLCLSTQTLTIRVNSLVCLGKLLEYMDRWYVIDTILPIMPQIPSREPAVLMSVLGIYRVAMTHKKLGLTKDVMAQKVLPFLFPLSIDNNLNLSQFNAFIGVVKEMVQAVEKEHRGKLEQLDTLQKEQRTLQQYAQEAVQGTEGVQMGGGGGGGEKDDTMMDKFLSGLGIGNFFGANSGGGNPEKKVVTSPSNNAINQLSDIPTPKQADTQLPNNPTKVQLTMEEKAKLARDQEQTRRLKSQTPLQLNSSVPTSARTTSAKPQAKDLTSTLMSNNLGGLSSSKPPAPSYTSSTFSSGGMAGTGGMMGNGGMAGTGGMMGNGGFSSGGSTFSSGGNSSFSSNSAMGFSTSSSSGGTGFGGTTTNTSSMFGASGMGGGSSMAAPRSNQNKPAASKSMDMSAFDSLLPSQAKPSMNAMAQQRPAFQQPQNNMGGGAYGMMGGAMGGNRPMMAPQGGFGAQPMMGGQQGMMGGAMGSQPMMGGGGGFMTPQNMSQPQNKPASNLSSQDINDLLG